MKHFYYNKLREQDIANYYSKVCGGLSVSNRSWHKKTVLCQLVLNYLVLAIFCMYFNSENGSRTPQSAHRAHLGP